MNFLNAFAAEAAKESQADPELLALYIAGAAYPDLDVVKVQRQLDDLAYAVQQATGLPVFDASTLINFGAASVTRSRFRGLY